MREKDESVGLRSTNSMATGRGRENDAMEKARSGMGCVGKDVPGYPKW